MNENHPLVEAMQRPRKAPMMPTNPTLECGAGTYGEAEVGAPVTLSVQGIVKSIGEDGKAVVEVQQIAPDDADNSMVMTQESHAP